EVDPPLRYVEPLVRWCRVHYPEWRDWAGPLLCVGKTAQIPTIEAPTVEIRDRWRSRFGVAFPACVRSSKLWNTGHLGPRHPRVGQPLCARGKRGECTRRVSIRLASPCG